MQSGSPRLRHLPAKQLSLALPTPISARLDAMRDLAEQLDEHTSRKELVAALILAAPKDPEHLAVAVQDYRAASIIDALMPGLETHQLLNPARSRGPRPQRPSNRRETRQAARDSHAELNEPLSTAPAYRVGIAVPGPLETRVDQLVEAAHAGGIETNRREVIASLVLRASDEPEELVRTVRAYRRATTEDLGVARPDRDASTGTATHG
jgi:hypothetical protein